MKRLLSLLLVLMTVLAMTPPAALAGTAGENSALYNRLLDAFGLSSYIGTVEIVKSGYMNAYKSNDRKSGIVFRVHHGERFWCKEETDDGWYAIQFIDGTVGYVLQKDTALERDVTDAAAFSTIDTEKTFNIVTVRKADVYSQPRSRAQSRRETDSDTITYYFSSGTELTGYGKTVRENKEWYLFHVYSQGGNGIPEMAWLLAADCELIDGDPDVNIIPDWWYD